VTTGAASEVQCRAGLEAADKLDQKGIRVSWPSLCCLAFLPHRGDVSFRGLTLPAVPVMMLNVLCVLVGSRTSGIAHWAPCVVDKLKQGHWLLVCLR